MKCRELIAVGAALTGVLLVAALAKQSLSNSIASSVIALPDEAALQQVAPAPPTTPVVTRPRLASPFPSFNSEQLDKQVRRYLQFIANNGGKPPDVLIVGSSRALWGVDPIALQTALADRGYSDLRVYNFGVNGATAQVIDLILRQVLTPDQLPRLILWADGSRAFNSGRTDRTYAKIIASQGYQQVRAGRRPVMPPTTAQLKQLCPDVPLLPDRSSWNPSIAAPPSAAIADCRSRLEQVTQAGIATQQAIQNPTALQEAAGFLPKSEQFNPDIYYQRHPRIPGSYDGDYRNFTLYGQQTAALQNVLRFARSRNIPVVFVNLPLTRVYLDSTRSTHERQFRRYLQRLAAADQLVLIDLSQRWQSQFSYFVDPSHLNRYGAAVVGKQLGQQIVLTPFNARRP